MNKSLSYSTAHATNMNNFRTSKSPTQIDDEWAHVGKSKAVV